MIVLYCTLLASAQSSEEKQKIEEKMRSDSQLIGILHSLERETEKNDLIQEERERRNAARKSKIESDLSEADGADKKEDDDMETDANVEENAAKTGRLNKEGTELSPHQILNLEDLQFAQGGHFMGNKKCQLPEGSFRKQKKGYEEVHVPASKPKSAESHVRPLPGLKVTI